jgi:hypothetical protein
MIIVKNLTPSLQTTLKIFYGLNLKEGQSVSDFEAGVIDTYCLSQGLKSPLVDE